MCAVVQGAWGQTTVDLSTITGDYTIPDGATVTGTSKDKKYMISIAAGATITLSGITIEQDGSETGYNYPVLTCKGDATIILAEGTTNKVESSHLECPCIYVPRYHTLTIQGRGTLIADS